MAVGTLVTNKMRSALTILGHGHRRHVDRRHDVAHPRLRRPDGVAHPPAGSDTVYVAKMSIVSFAAGKEFWDLMRRPDI